MDSSFVGRRGKTRALLRLSSNDILLQVLIAARRAFRPFDKEIDFFVTALQHLPIHLSSIAVVVIVVVISRQSLTSRAADDA
jgi:hypothetical protein